MRILPDFYHGSKLRYAVPRSGGIRPTGQHGPASVWGDDARRPRTVFQKGRLKMSLLIPVYRLQLVRGSSFGPMPGKFTGRRTPPLFSPHIPTGPIGNPSTLPVDTMGRVTGLHVVGVDTLDQVDVHPCDVFNFASR